MTVRLIALMSAVLLLSLAALALLLGHFQAGVMTELEKTVSWVGKETIRSLERPLPGLPHEPGLATRRVMIRHDQGRIVIREDEKPEQVIDLRGTGEEAGLTWDHEAAITQAREDRSGVGPAVVEPGEVIPGEAVASEAAALADRFIVRLEGVKAVDDPGRGLLLRIPTRSGVPAVAGRVVVTPTVGAGFTTAGTAPASGSEILEREILLPVPTRHYQELFAGMRQKTVLLFLAVFVVGTALSAALASRFTRPIRKLDAGIRRLSRGDLDVAVEVGGSQEIGRLGRAFNEMARELRAGRDRARDLTRKEKLSALGRLASGVAHDVRNPLHSIGLTLQHIHDTCRPGEPERGAEFDRALDLIRSEIRRLDRLVSNFLAFARSDRRERGPVDLAGLVADVARLVEKEAERRGVTVEVVGPGAGETVPTVHGDAEAIRSSVLNLVLNSFEAMAGGGRLRLALGTAPGEVRLEVADTGRGIPAADQEKVFEFAYSSREGGTGLGLAMVHQVVVEDHGGRVALRSAPGEGTRVTLGFPLAVPGTAPEAPA